MDYSTIGLIGHKGAGKDTAYAALRDLGFRNEKFAAPLKNMLRTLLGDLGHTHKMIERMIEGDLKEFQLESLGGVTPRLAMQTLGTEWGRRHLGEDFWVAAAMRRADVGNGRVAFTDVRYENEVEAIRREGGLVVRITRPGLPVDLSHESERFVAEVKPDMEIVNDCPDAAAFENVVYRVFHAGLNWQRLFPLAANHETR